MYNTEDFVNGQELCSMVETSAKRDQESQEVFSVEEGQISYVPTNLKKNPFELDRGSGNVTSAYFFVARGATGKTALAQYISQNLRAPLWRTSVDSTINAHSLRVHLLDYTAEHNIDQLLASESNPLVVVDSLDEAMVAVSGTTWAQFKTSMVKMAAKGVRFIFTGREIALLDLMGDFEAEDIDFISYKVEHFDKPQAKEFVNSICRDQGKQIDVNNKIYDEALNVLLNRLSVPGLGEAEQQQFLGYAPVLQAVAADIASSANLARDLRLMHERSWEEDLNQLDSIMQSILEREQEKFLSSYSSSDETLFTPDEQIRALLSRRRLAPEPLVPSAVDLEKKEIYKEKREAQILDHPFVNGTTSSFWASKIFEAYCVLKGYKYIDDPRKLHQEASKNPTLFLLAPVLISEEEIYDDWIVSTIHNSFLAYNDSTSEGTGDIGSRPGRVVQVAETKQADVYSYSVLSFDSNLSEIDSDLEIKFIPSFDREIVFRGQPAHINFNVANSNIRVEPESSALILGPGFGVVAEQIEFTGGEMRLPTLYSEPLNVILAARKFKLPIARLELSGTKSCPDIVDMGRKLDYEPAENYLPYPWREFVRPLESLSFGSRLVIGPEILHIVSAFEVLKSRRYRASGVSRSGFCALSSLHKKNPTTTEVIQVLCDFGILADEGGTYSFAADDEVYPLFATPYSRNSDARKKFNDLTNEQRRNWIAVIEKLNQILGEE